MTDDPNSERYQWILLTQLTIKFSFDQYNLFYCWWFYNYLHTKLGNLLMIGSKKQMKIWACAKKSAKVNE